ncbi:MAG: hypothetical protein JNL69_03335 [Bacteroidia bacterium]|nr:hypothetical protein [Bacteroidia bacterium]
MEELNFQENNNGQQTKRPLLLTILCILTFISSGLGIMSALTTPFLADYMIELFNATPGFDKMLTPEAIAVLKAGWFYYLMVTGFTVMSLFGAIYMWKLQKIGFHLYTIANIIIYCLPSIIVGLPFHMIGLIFPGMFVALYTLNLKFMK